MDTNLIGPSHEGWVGFDAGATGKPWTLSARLAYDDVNFMAKGTQKQPDGSSLDGDFVSVRKDLVGPPFNMSDWAYVKRRTGVDLLGILRDLAAERTAQHGE